MICVACGDYFKQDAYNKTNMCCNCLDTIVEDDPDAELEIRTLLNPNGRVRASIFDDEDEGYGL